MAKAEQIYQTDIQGVEKTAKITSIMGERNMHRQIGFDPNTGRFDELMILIKTIV